MLGGEGSRSVELIGRGWSEEGALTEVGTTVEERLKDPI